MSKKLQWASKWHQKSTQWCPNPLKKYLGRSLFAILKPTRFQKVTRSPRGFILYDLLCILGHTWPQLYRFWKQFWHRLLHNVVAIAARHGTHAENLQRTSSNNRYQTLAAKHSTNASSKHSMTKRSMQNTCRELAKHTEI